MNILIKFLCYGFVTIFILSVGVYSFSPKTVDKVIRIQREQVAKLSKKKCVIEGHTLHYYEHIEPKKDTLVILHGLGDSKSGFLRTAKYFAEDYYLIIPDLPGHGENEKIPSHDYSFFSQAEYLSKFFDKLCLRNFHVVGVSTGGLLTLAIANNNHCVKSITLVNTPAIPLTLESFFLPFSKKLKTIDDLNNLLNLIFYRPPSLFGPTEQLILDNLEQDLKFIHQTIISSWQNESFGSLDEQLATLQIPSLILHSTKDSLVPIDHASYYNNILPNAIYGTLKNTAHYPHYENPWRFASSIIGHLKRTNQPN